MQYTRIADSDHAVEVERATLGSVLFDSDTFEVVHSIVRPSDFLEPDLQSLYREMIAASEIGEPIDARLLAVRLSKYDSIENPSLLLAEVLTSVTTSAHAEYYAKCVAEASRKRQLALLGNDLRIAASNGLTSSTVFAMAQDRLAQIATPNSGRSRLGSMTITFDPVPISEVGQGESPDFIWQGWLAVGSTTLLVAHAKCGKTTLVSHLLAAASQNSGDIGGAIQPCRVAVVSEEPSQLWKDRRCRLQIGDAVHIHTRPFRKRPSQAQWERFVDSLTEAVEKTDYKLVVIDTFQAVSPAFDENDSAQMMAALLPLHAIVEAGAAVLIVHHSRKSDGAEGNASRGSGALTGFVDVIVELRRYDPSKVDDSRRVLRGFSRYCETPREIVIELGESGYNCIGDRQATTQSDKFDAIEKVLADSGRWMTAAEILEAWNSLEAPPKERTLKRWLKDGHQVGKWQRTGKGKSGYPYRYAATEEGGDVVSCP